MLQKGFILNYMEIKMIYKYFYLVAIFLTTVFLTACGGGGGGGGGTSGSGTSGSGTSGSGTSDVDVSTFDGTWYSPCFNNAHDFSARQKLTINGTSLISNIESHANAPASTPDCELPSSQIIASDITATLNYGSNTQKSSCVNNTGVQSSITLIKNESSGVLINTQPDLANSIELVTGRKDDFLPTSTVICLKPNGNLLFAGYEYTPATNSTIIEAPTVVPPIVPSSTIPKWSVGSYNYVGGASSAGYTNSSNSDIGSLAVTTAFDTSNGDYSGSGITITHTLKGAGVYSLNENLSEDNFSHKRIDMRVTVGTGIIHPNGGGAVLYRATSGTIKVTIDSNGKYHFTTTSPITLSDPLFVGNGIPGSPETFSFTMNNIYDFKH